jgi:hypothetical protein
MKYGTLSGLIMTSSVHVNPSEFIKDYAEEKFKRTLQNI